MNQVKIHLNAIATSVLLFSLIGIVPMRTSALSGDTITVHGAQANAILNALSNAKIPPRSVSSDKVQYSLKSIDCSYRRRGPSRPRIRYARCQIVDANGTATTLTDIKNSISIQSALQAAGAKVTSSGVGVSVGVINFEGQLDFKDQNTSEASFTSR